MVSRGFAAGAWEPKKSNQVLLGAFFKSLRWLSPAIAHRGQPLPGQHSESKQVTILFAYSGERV